MKVNIHVIKS